MAQGVHRSVLDEDTERFKSCPVCGAERKPKEAFRLANAEDLEGWICSGACGQKWWGAADLIASLQIADLYRNHAPAKRLGMPLLWEERGSSGSANILKFREDDQPWYVNWSPRHVATQLRDAYLMKLDFAGLRRFLRTLDAIRRRPHRMLGGRPKYTDDGETP